MAKPDPVKEAILNKADIVDVVSQYVQLKKRGSRYFGLSPFQREKTPSFSVHPEKQYFQCFASGKVGNVIDFVMEVEHLTFFEAKQFLANKLGIPMESVSRSKMSHKEIDRFQVMDNAAQLYRKWLKNTPDAVSYLHSRGLSEEQMDRFSLGFAPNQWDSLHHALNQRNIPEKVQVELGLAVSRQNSSGCYDRFRNRIMFPIRNLLGRVIAFGGRTLDPNDQAKYLNSSDSPVFNKSRVLYLLDLAKNVITQRGVILVEGYMDAIALHVHGFEQAVATLGTALTKDHINILKRYTNKFTLLYDSDAAGINAALRGVELFFEYSINPRVLQIPDGKDPDDYLKNNSPESLQSLLENAPNGFEFYLLQKIKGIDLHSPEGKSQAVQSVVPLLAKIREEFVRQEYFSLVASRIGLDLETLTKTIQQSLKENKQFQPRDEEIEVARPVFTQKPSDMVQMLKRDLIRLLSCHLGLVTPEGMSARQRPNIFSPDEINGPVVEYLKKLGDGSIEQRVLDILLKTPLQKINNLASHLESLFPQKEEMQAFMFFSESEPLPGDEKLLHKMRDETLAGLRQEAEKRFHQDLLLNKQGDYKEWLKQYNDYIFK